MTEFHEHFRRVATRFLRTALVLDDKAYGRLEAIDGVLRPPPSRRSYRSDQIAITDNKPTDDLNSGRLVEGFARHGILCGVLDCVPGTEEPDELMNQADIVVLDWHMRGDYGAFALERIRRLAVEQHRLRIVAIYTGEPRLDVVGERIRESKVADGQCWEELPSEMLRCHNCYVALYCKEDTNPQPSFASRVVREDELADKVMSDFVQVVAGLVPALTLTVLAAVRDNAYRLLSGFGKRLDPAFLCHRACLPTPDDAETFVVGKVAGEMEEIMEEAVAAVRPAGVEAISAWMKNRTLSDEARKEMQRLLTSGKERKDELSSTELKGKSLTKRYRWFTEALAGEEASALDLEFAWVASQRVVVGQAPRKLHLGTIVRRGYRETEEFYVCIRPRCDSVRLKGRTPFLFLVLTEPKGGMGVATVVVKSGSGFVKKTVSSTPFVHDFEPLGESGTVETRVGSRTGRCFVDCGGTEFEWLGELRQEFAQRIVQQYGGQLGRVAAEDTEWLRRGARNQ